MGVDGFRFDLAPVIGRTEHDFDRHAPIFEQIEDDKSLRDIKMIAEPWDVGPGGYQVGGFPDNWSEWNDRYRDVVQFVLAIRRRQDDRDGFPLDRISRLLRSP